MIVSPQLLEWLQQWEGPPHFAPRQDPCVPGVWDIGYGHVCARDRAPITPQQADELLRADAETFAVVVEQLAPGGLLQHEADALTAFAFNVGRRALAESTLLRLVNAGDMEGAAAQFGRWNKAGGVPVRGLTKRREAERVMFQNADYSQLP